MVQTITTDFQFVTDGETTVENPGDIVGNNNIIISNAEIEWEGTTETSSSTSYSTNTNTGSATATTGSTTSTDFNRNNSDIAQAYVTTADTTETDTFTDEAVFEYEDVERPASATARAGNLQSWKDNVDSWSVTYETKLSNLSADSMGTFSTNYVEYDTPSSYVEWSGDLDDSEGNWLQVASFSGSGNFPKDQFEMESFADDDSEPLRIGSRLTVTVDYYPDIIKNETVSTTYPPVPDGYNFDYHRREISGETNETISTNKVGETVSRTSTSTDEAIGITLETHGTKTNYYTNSDTTTVSYPSVPSGHSFDRHYYREEKNGSFVDSDYIYTNKVGDTRSVTSNDPSNTWELTMQTRGEQTTTTTTETENPSVSGDVSASYSGTLGSKEYSSWQPLSGFALGDNTFTHDIGGTNEASYRIRFDYELSFPTVVDEAKVTVGNTTYDVILADPTDENVVYDFLRVNHPTHGVLAFDVVNKDNADAFGYYVTDSNGNVRALRENTQ